jgi:hypothetical protein
VIKRAVVFILPAVAVALEAVILGAHCMCVEYCTMDSLHLDESVTAKGEKVKTKLTLLMAKSSPTRTFRYHTFSTNAPI